MLTTSFLIFILIFFVSNISEIMTYDKCFFYEDLQSNHVPNAMAQGRVKHVECHQEHEVCCQNQIGCCLAGSTMTLVGTTVFVSFMVFSAVFTLVLLYACTKTLIKRYYNSLHAVPSQEHSINHNINLHLDLSTAFQNEHLPYSPPTSPLTPITPPPIYSVAIFLPIPPLNSTSRDYDKIPTYEQAVAKTIT